MWFQTKVSYFWYCHVLNLGTVLVPDLLLSCTCYFLVLVRNRDCKLWSTITDTPSHPLYQLLPPKKQRFLRNRGHDFILPAVNTERFKRSFINRCLFNFI